MKNILVIGGAGFIGSHLSETLANENNITVIDNLYLGKEENLKNIRNKIQFIKEDYTNSKLIHYLIIKNNIEYIYHFGGLSSAPMFDENEAEGFTINISGFANLLRASLHTKVKRILYASTSSLYGSLPTQSEDVKVFPPNFYSITKYTMEHTARLFYEMYGLESIGFRFFSVYGKNEKHKKQYANLISQFLWAIEDNKTIEVYGDGEQKRDFTYVNDIVKALILGMSINSDFAKGSHYNIGTSQSYTLNQMIKILMDETKKTTKIKYIKNPIKNYVSNTIATTNKIEKDFNFKPTFNLKSGIRDLLS